MNRETHMEALAKRFGGWTYEWEVTLDSKWRTWRRMELNLHSMYERDCAVDDKNLKEQIERFENEYAKRIANMFRDREKVKSELFFNHDPRGYAIKFDVPRNEQPGEFVRDWGDYVILAPDSLK